MIFSSDDISEFHGNVSLHWARSMLFEPFYRGIISSIHVDTAYKESECHRISAGFVVVLSMFASESNYHVLIEYLIPLLDLYKKDTTMKPIVIVDSQIYIDNGFLEWNDMQVNI